MTKGTTNFVSENKKLTSYFRTEHCADTMLLACGCARLLVQSLVMFALMCLYCVQNTLCCYNRPGAFIRIKMVNYKFLHMK